MDGGSSVKTPEQQLRNAAATTATGESQVKEEGGKAVLLVGKCVLRETGNATTLDRLGRAVKGDGWECVTCDPDSLPDVAAVHALVTQHNIVAALGIHAYRSAPVLLACQELGIPYVLMFGGTDVNECVREAAKKDVMQRVVTGARSLVAFQAATRDTVLQVWPSLHHDKIWILPQAVQVNPNLEFDVLLYLESMEAAHVAARTHKEGQDTNKTQLSNRNAEVESVPLSVKDTYTTTLSHRTKENGNHIENKLSRGSEAVTAQNTSSGTITNGIFCQLQQRQLSGTREALPDVYHPLVLLVAGLRPVKDVLYLAEAWSGWQKARGGRGKFLILGPALDPQYTAHVHAQVDRLSGVRVCPALAPEECQALMSSATVLVNSSRSESMSSAILEAMALGTPVIARNIPGNAALITHRRNGLLYATPEGFLQELDTLLQDAALHQCLISTAKDYVARYHSLQQEKDLLLRILKEGMQ